MILLLLGLALWSVVHLLPAAAPARRAAYAEKLGPDRTRRSRAFCCCCRWC